MKSLTFSIGAVLCVMAALCHPATAQNRFRVIEYRTGNPDKVVTQYNTSNDVTHPVAQTTYQVSLLGGADDTPTELYNNDIARVTLTGGPSGLLTIVVGYSFGETDEQQTAAARNWNGLVVSPSSANRRLSGGILGNLTGSITGVRSMSRLDVQGELRANVKAEEPHNGSLFVIEAGSITATGGVHLVGGNINRVRTNVGNMAGALLAEQGDIVQVAVASNLSGTVESRLGNIGTITVDGSVAHSQPAGAKIRALQGIGSIIADAYTDTWIAASIDQYDSILHDGRIGKLLTRAGGQCQAIVQASSMSSSVADNRIEIKGNLTKELGFNNAGMYGQNDPYLTIAKPITISGDLSAAGAITIDCGVNSVLRIDHSMLSNIRFRNNCMLQGQIIINGGNAGGTWATDKKVQFYGRKPSENDPFPFLFEIDFDHRDYTQTSAQLGGGAIGIVPFKLHANDCDPVKNDSPPPVILDSAFNQRSPLGDSNLNKSVILKFYGPVFKPTANPPIKVEVSTGSQWEDRAGVAFIDGGGSTSTLRRDVIVHGGNGSGTFMPGEYRVTLPDPANAADRLRCAQTSAATPPEVAPFTYYFTLKSDCNLNNVDDAIDLTVRVDPNDPNSPLKYDLDGDGNIDSCERATNGWPCPADFDTDTFVNGNDYDWFAYFFDLGDPLADMNGDWFVNGNDYDLFAEHFDAGC